MPEVAIGNDQQGSYVFIVNEKNVVERRSVKTGPVVDGLRVIEEGLKGKEWVIVKGLLKAAPGRQVTPEREGVRTASASLSSISSSKEGRAMISKFFIERPIFANVIAFVTIIIGAGFPLSSAGGPVSPDRATDHPGDHALSGGERRGCRGDDRGASSNRR